VNLPDVAEVQSVRKNPTNGLPFTERTHLIRLTKQSE
jgi:hypothetical protein